jgi:branched-chain amino acid transport system permease protein
MIIIMLLRPRGLWPAPEHGKSLQNPGTREEQPNMAHEQTPY